MLPVASFCSLIVLAVFAHVEALGDHLPKAAGSFANPSVTTRPKFRYWLPDASVDASVVADDITGLGLRGAGGIEFLNYFNYGGAQGPPPEEVDWTIYGFATPAYRDILEKALKTTKDNGLIMDYSMGPQSGQGVPAEPDEIGLSWELVSFNTSYVSRFHGQIPGWGSGDLVSLSIFDVIKTRIVPALAMPAANKTQYTISASSLADLTDLVSPNGTITLGDHSTNHTDSTILYASYARRSYARADIASSEHPQNKLQNGSFAVDHFSTAGADLKTQFLEDYVIQVNSTIRALLKDVGLYIWEDSVEISTPTYWTPKLPKVFAQQHGYDLRKYVPFLTGFNGDLMANDPPIQIVSDSLQGSEFVDEFRTTLTRLYKGYLTALKNWSHNYVEMDFSAQVGYNLPLDMLSSIPAVDVPETETLSFLNNVDGFRQYAGPTDLADKKIVSIELGADYGQVYSQPLALLIEEASRAYSVGINQVVIHGGQYSGNYPQTTYPGFTTFGYAFAGHHSRQQPAWDLGYRSMLDWLARAQFVLQSGTPKIDIVFWDKQTAQDPFPKTSYGGSDLTDAGYSYTYLSPDNFELPVAVVEDGILASQTLGAKVLVLRRNDTLTTFGVDKLAVFAHEGLPIVIDGGVPDKYTTTNTSAIDSANATLHSLLSLPNVYATGQSSSNASSDLASLLSSHDLLPRAKVQTNGTWYTRYIADTASSSTSIFIFSDTNTSTNGTISVRTQGTPFLLDLWNGIETPILEYNVDGEHGTSIPLTIAAKQAVLIQFQSAQNSSSSEGPQTHFINAPHSVLGYTYDAATHSLTAKIGHDFSNTTQNTPKITLSNNQSVLLNSSALTVAPSFPLSNWTLVAEKWQPPSNLSDVNGVIKENVTIQLRDAALPAWPRIALLANASGIGRYASTFAWPPHGSSCNASAQGALIEIPATQLVQGMSVSVNGRKLLNVDLFRPTLDISSALRCGENLVAIEVSTTLWNSLRPIWDRVMTGGVGPQLPVLIPGAPELAPEQDVGLVGEVNIVPYQAVRIA